MEEYPPTYEQRQCPPGGYIPPTRNPSCQEYLQQKQYDEEVLKGPSSSQNQGHDPYLCERCRKRVTPIEDSNPSCKTHIVAIVLFVLGLPFLVFLPYCFDWFGKPVSRCPKCGHFMNPPPST
ncbi:unnamed protein product [Orchesella dallaii]|uniref:LITAF domain-containing protein n=1 Tax=Orchesella dallaii TaxID=48710 RepID=A0ABP1QXZ3_9HEXA